MSEFNAQGQFTGESIDLDDVAGRGAFIKPGRYNAHLAAVTGVAASKSSGKPMVTATWEIADGENEGLEVNTYYTMIILAPKKAGGKAFAPGIADLKAALAAVGAPLAPGYQFPTKDGAGNFDKAANLLAKGVANKVVELLVQEEPMKDKITKEPVLNEDGTPKKSTRVKVLGLVGRSATVPGATEGDVL